MKKRAHEGAGTTASPLAFDGRRIVLVHGATYGPWVFDEWADSWAAHWPDVHVRVPDLQEGLDVAHATMSDDVDRVLAAVGDRPTVLCGWSMGGLVAMMAARSCQPAALVLIEHSVPAIACPLLVVAGRDYVDSRGRPVAEQYGAELMEFPELSHFQLVADPRVRDAVAQWLSALAP